MDYNLEEAFSRIEEDLTTDIINSIKTASSGTIKGGKTSVWKANQLKALQDFKKRNKSYFSKESEKEINDAIESEIKKVYKKGMKKTEKEILDKIKLGLLDKKPVNVAEATFNGVNDRKLKALIKETTDRLKDARYAALRYSEDQYRKIIFDSATFLEAGAGSLDEAIDMATRDFLAKGITCIEYANGSKVNIQSYAEMALRTAEKRSYMQGEAAMRDEYGLGLVIVTRRGNACPKCMRFVGKIYNDDVYGNQPIDPRYPKLSTAIAGGLYHPNCRDVHTTYFEGITTKRPAPTKAEKEEAERIYKLEQQQRYNERQIRKYKRLADGTLEEDQKKTYTAKLKEWQQIQAELIDSNDELRRKYNRERVVKLTTPPSTPKTEEKKTGTLITFDEGGGEKQFFRKFTNNNEVVQNTKGLKTSIGKYRKLKVDTNDPNEIYDYIEKTEPNIIKKLDSMIEQSEINENFQVSFASRGVNDYAKEFGVDFRTLSVGEKINVKGYVNCKQETSKALYVISSGSENRCVYNLNIPKGKGNAIKVQGFDLKRDIFLKKDSEFIVRNIETVNGVTIIDLDMISADGTKINSALLNTVHRAYERETNMTRLNEAISRVAKINYDRDEYTKKAFSRLNKNKSDIMSIKEIKNKSEIIPVLKKLGFNEIDIPDYVDDDVIIKQINQLVNLNKKYGINSINERQNFIVTTDNKTEALAWVSNYPIRGEFNLVLNNAQLTNEKNIVDITTISQETKWWAKSDEAHKPIYVLTHESGHMVHNFIYDLEFGEYPSWEYQKSKINTYRDEILEIATAIDEDADIEPFISGYGKTNSSEFFAEAFANAECGEPNLIGEAMEIWLKAKGVII